MWRGGLGEKRIQGRGAPQTTTRGSGHALRVRGRGHENRLQGSTSIPDHTWPLFLWKEWTCLSRVLWSPWHAFFVLFWRAEHGTAVVSHLEKVPGHTVAWESVSQLYPSHPPFFFNVFFFRMSCTVNLKLNKVTENKCYYGKSTMLFETFQAVWHVVLHLKLLHLIKIKVWRGSASRKPGWPAVRNTAWQCRQEQER